MKVYVLSEDAEIDLDDIWEYIAHDNLDAADRWIDQPDRAVLSGACVSYHFIYRAIRKPVEIFAIPQGSRDIPPFLQRRNYGISASPALSYHVG